jgi:hypothetical protein
MDFVPQVYDGMNASLPVFETWASSPCKSEPDIWMRRVNNHYEYIATYVDGFAISSKDPKAITDTLMNKYNFKLRVLGRLNTILACHSTEMIETSCASHPNSTLRRR